MIHMLQDNGHSAYVVGGCVRDSILNRRVHDWDICTSATPAEMLEIFKDKKIIETGLQHGTITVVLDGETYEITTYRIDGVYSDNRRPDSVEFTDRLEEDLKRRDFTINAMAYNDDVGIIDPFGGMIDLKDQTIRCVGSPKERFDEDALRILRAIRFAAQLDFSIDYKTSNEVLKNCENLNNISMERINSEFCKIAASPSFSKFLLKYFIVFWVFIPELVDMVRFEHNNPCHEFDVFFHTYHALRYCNSEDLIVMLAVLFHDIGKPHCYQDTEGGIRRFSGHWEKSEEMTDIIMRRMRFDNYTRERVLELVFWHDFVIEADKPSVKRMLNEIGEEQFWRLLEVKKADAKAHTLEYARNKLREIEAVEKILKDVIKNSECFSLNDLAINGKDLIQLGFKQGKEIGEVLDRLLQDVIDESLKNEKDVLLQFARLIYINDYVLPKHIGV